MSLGQRRLINENTDTTRRFLSARNWHPSHVRAPNVWVLPRSLNKTFNVTVTRVHEETVKLTMDGCHNGPCSRDSVKDRYVLRSASRDGVLNHHQNSSLATVRAMFSICTLPD